MDLDIPHSERAQAILDFWFGNPHAPDGEYGQQRKVWFQKNQAFDAALRQHFLADYDRAQTGSLEAWILYPRSCLALILLLDQVPRNIFRGSPKSFATDGKALSVSRYAINHQHDQRLIPVERIFVYLPLEHSETLTDQDLSVQLFQALVDENPELETTLDYANRHREVIRQFGRFPHRNAILNRATTDLEAEFLQQPGSRF